MGRRFWILVPAVVLAAVAVTACGDDDDTRSPSTTATSLPGVPTGDDTTPPGNATTSTITGDPIDVEPVASAGCGASTAEPTDLARRTLDVDGTERWFLLTTPDAHDGETPLPLVLDFHGLAEGAEIHTRMSSFGELAEQEGFVVAFPNGTGALVRWRVSQRTADSDDLPFIDQLLDTLETELCIDTARVYATGLSNGAFMSSILACQRADRFAAVAAVAGLLFPDACEPSRPIPVLTFHGTADPILLFNGGVGDRLTSALSGGADPEATLPPADLNGEGYPANVASWADLNGCEPEPTETDVSEEVIQRTYDCPPDASVEFYIVDDGGHAWPGSAASRAIKSVVGYTTLDIDATALAWEWFHDHPLPA